jgi:hypothetical protein
MSSISDRYWRRYGCDERYVRKQNVRWQTVVCGEAYGERRSLRLELTELRANL